jgi:hypothetical protein
MNTDNLLGKTNFTFGGKVVATIEVHSIRQMTREGDYYLADVTIDGERKTIPIHKAAS